jgi:hypothetical protein
MYDCLSVPQEGLKSRCNSEVEKSDKSLFSNVDQLLPFIELEICVISLESHYLAQNQGIRTNKLEASSVIQRDESRLLLHLPYERDSI